VLGLVSHKLFGFCRTASASIRQTNPENKSQKGATKVKNAKRPT
jgi:hypothetical protein